ncbi:ankyrin repeat-containing domain protein [Xylogone sp. PMI_703]|nr:ankyrin repeat-containing domain protein [Xylogone sp. PMI_703]
MLKRYLETFNPVLLPFGINGIEQFTVAAAYGSIDAFRLLIEYCVANHPAEMETLYKEGQIILDWACKSGCVEMVRFLLNNQPPFGSIQERAYHRTPLLHAAASFTCSTFTKNYGKRLARRDCLAKSEELVQFLLDQGACARDKILPLILCELSESISYEDLQTLPPFDTVLSLAMAGASPQLIDRLINEGADVCGKKIHLEFNPEYVGQTEDVTILHIGARYLNTEGIQALLDRQENNVDIINMVSCRDSRGSLPLHWAARGPDQSEKEGMFHEDDVALYAINTIRLLLASNPDTINVQDSYGETALHCVIKSHHLCGPQHSDVVAFLCQNGADASLRDTEGLPPTSLLLAYGANIDDVDMHGDTILHYAANNLGHFEMVQFLLNQGANANIRNSRGDTPLQVAAGEVVYPPKRAQTLGDRQRLLDEMMKTLQGAGDVNLMDEVNIEGKTPRQMQDETKKRWRDAEEIDRLRRRGLLKDGMGRG